MYLELLNHLAKHSKIDKIFRQYLYFVDLIKLTIKEIKLFFIFMHN